MNSLHEICRMTICSFRVRVIVISLSLTVVLLHAGSDLEARSIESEQQAIESARSFLSLSGEDLRVSTSQGVTATLQTEIDSTTPFLSDSLDGRRAWKVAFASVILGLDSYPREVILQSPRTLTALIDSASGKLIRVESWLVSAQALQLSKPLVLHGEAERQLGSERWLTLPTTDPKVSFFEAVNKAAGSKLTAKLIVGHYINAVVGDSAGPKAVWSIHLIDFPPILHGETSMRSVIDATTGKLLYFCNLPRSEL